MADDKKTKAEAEYGEGHKDAHCGICRHFEPPKSCAVVAGEIHRDMWCRYFKRKSRVSRYGK